MSFLSSRIFNIEIDLFRKLAKNMSVFIQKLNPLTGETEWDTQDENYDYHQEIARSAYADMLHDTERNKKYFSALQEVISSLKKQHRPVHVLDIGTGTGLLSMMAATCGADSVTACEAFVPMANCCRKILNENNLSDKIRLIPKRSTEMTVGPDRDMFQRANVLVAEVFDTELIGEGAIQTFSHAREHLLEDDCIIIPTEAVVYAQVVESEMLEGWNTLGPIAVSDNNIIDFTKSALNCEGTAALFDLQLSQFSPDKFHPITEPLPVFKFDFEKGTLHKHRTNSISTSALRDGTAQGVFMWWDLKMHANDTELLSCAPKWTHVHGDNAQWRDHWMQAIYFIPKQVNLTKSEGVTLHASHDEYALWFNIEKGNSSHTNGHTQPPECQCGFHLACSRTRLGMMNDKRRLSQYISAMKDIVDSESFCLSLSDGSLLPLIAGRLGAKKVVALEPRLAHNRLINQLVEENSLSNKISVVNGLENVNTSEVNVVLAEPFFLTSILPWDNMQFWYKYCAANLDRNVKVMPQSAELWGVAVKFEDLWKIKAPVHTVEGFDLTTFDKLIESSSAISDPSVEPHPLWEYPCTALSKPVQFFKFDFTAGIPKADVEENGTIKCTGSNSVNGIALWMDWNLDGKRTLSTGPLQPVVVDDTITWDMYTRQGVHFPKTTIISNSSTHSVVSYHALFNPTKGTISFSFEI